MIFPDIMFWTLSKIFIVKMHSKSGKTYKNTLLNNMNLMTKIETLKQEYEIICSLDEVA